jgi:hypothetical protein
MNTSSVKIRTNINSVKKWTNRNCIKLTGVWQLHNTNGRIAIGSKKQKNGNCIITTDNWQLFKKIIFKNSQGTWNSLNWNYNFIDVKQFSEKNNFRKNNILKEDKNIIYPIELKKIKKWKIVYILFFERVLKKIEIWRHWEKIWHFER